MLICIGVVRAHHADGLLRFNVVQRALGIRDTKNFKNDVRRHSDFVEALNNHGIAEAWRMGDNRRGFLKC